MSFEVLTEVILLGHLILYTNGHQFGLIEVSVFVGVSLILQTSNYFFILIVAHQLSHYDKIRKDALKLREDFNKKIIEDAMVRAIADTSYNMPTDDSISIPHDYIEKAREKLMISTEMSGMAFDTSGFENDQSFMKTRAEMLERTNFKQLTLG